MSRRHFLEQVGRLHDDKRPISVTPHNSLLAVTSAPASPADETKIVPRPDTLYEKQTKNNHFMKENGTIQVNKN